MFKGNFYPNSSSGCLICYEKAKGNQPSQNLEKNQEMFENFCSVLKVDASSFISLWNAEEESFPFCSVCSKEIHQIIKTHEKLEKIQQDLNGKVFAIRQKLRESQSKFTSSESDIRIIDLHKQILEAEVEDPVSTQPTFNNFQTNDPAQIVPTEQLYTSQ